MVLTNQQSIFFWLFNNDGQRPFSNISVIIHAISWRSIWLEETGEHHLNVKVNLIGGNQWKPY